MEKTKPITYILKDKNGDEIGLIKTTPKIIGKIVNHPEKISSASELTEEEKKVRQIDSF